jgi:dGTPase
MASETDLFSELAVDLGLIKKAGPPFAWHRHPLAFLVEAADDICYHIMDVEDGFKAGVIKEEELFELHKPWIDDKARKKLDTLGEPQRKAEYLRAITIHTMIYEAHDVFEKNYDGLMSGEFDFELTAKMQSAENFAAFEKLTRSKVYKARPVLEIEACGFEVIGGLLSAFIDAIEIKATKSCFGKTRSRTILGLLPSGVSVEGLTPYQRALVATDFVSGMTGSYAVELYQRIRGITLP